MRVTAAVLVVVAVTTRTVAAAPPPRRLALTTLAAAAAAATKTLARRDHEASHARRAPLHPRRAQGVPRRRFSKARLRQGGVRAAREARHLVAAMIALAPSRRAIFNTSTPRARRCGPFIIF